MNLRHVSLIVTLFSFLSHSTLAQFDFDEFESEAKPSAKKVTPQKKSSPQSSSPQKGADRGNTNKANAETEQFKDAKTDKEYEVISVTGSHIKRANAEGASPMLVLDRAAMERSGYNSVSDVLRDVTANSFGSIRESAGSSAAGVATVSLRGLGSSKTLVLLNGKRLPQDPATGSVDLNLIPMAAVKRIDILKDGASATYGSDALGGVINIITYKDYTQTQITAQKSLTKLGNGETQNIDLVTGAATAKSSVLLVMSHRKNEALMSADRSWTRGGVSPTGSPGGYILRQDGAKWQADPNCPPERTVPFQGGTNCIFDFTPFATELPSIEQYNMMTTFEYKTDSNITLFGRGSFTQKRVAWQYAPSPGTFRVENIIDANGNSLGPGSIRYRTMELGNRTTDDESNAMGIQIGARGSVSDTWDWELTYDENRMRRTNLNLSGYALDSKLRALIDSGNFNPLKPEGERGDISSARYTPWQDTRALNQMTELKFSGELFNLKGGAVGAAVGVVNQRDKFSDQVDALSEQGEVFSSGGSSGGGKRESNSAYVEVIAPILKTLEIQLAARHDRFSDFGETTNPKIGVKYEATNFLTFRGSAGTGFMAPLMRDLYAAGSFGFPTFIDFVACRKEQQETPGNTPSCNPQQYAVSSGGNVDLKEEKSRTFNIGAILDINRKVNFTVDYWVTELDNVVGLDYNDLMRAELAGVDVSQYGVTTNRKSDGYLDETNPIRAPLLNLSKQRVSGIDLRIEVKPTNNFRIVNEHSYMLFYEQEGFPGVGFRNLLDTEPGLPRWRNNLTLTWGRDKFDTSFLFKTIADQAKAVVDQGRLPVYTEIDFNFNYYFTQNLTTYVGLQNLLSSTPPIDETNPNGRLNAGLFNPRGPVIFAGFKQTF